MIDINPRLLIYLILFSAIHANSVVETMLEAIEMKDDKEVPVHKWQVVF